MINKLSPQSMADEHLLPAALLEMGDSLNFIEVRKHTLREDIKGSKLSSATGKFSGIGSIVLGGVAAVGLSNPLGWISVGCGVAAYGLHVVEQWHKTGKIQIMPLSSKSQDDRDEDLAGQTVSGNGGNSTGRTAIHEDAAYLSDREKTEYELLHFAPQGLMNAMNGVHPPQRWACYQFLIDAFNAGTMGDYANPQALQDVLGSPDGYSSHLPEASERFPQYKLPSASVTSANDSAPVIEASPVGNTTRLGAIGVSSSPVATSSEMPTNKAEILARLRAECPALLKLIKSLPIRAVGVQRTGKTTLVKKLALLRLLFLPGHKVIASTPHHEPDNRYPSVFQVVGIKGGKRDYSAISNQWDAMAERIENGDRSSITTVWDEFGLFNKVTEEETLTSVLTSSLREANKHGEYPVFIVHGETQAFLPGSRGLVTVFLSSTVRVETIGELVTGADGLDEMRPTGKFRVKWLDGTREEGQIPEWLSEEFLISLLPTSVATNRQPKTYQDKPAETPNQVDEIDEDAPEIGLNKASVEEVKAQEKELFELGQAILDLLQKNPDKSYGDEAIRTNRFIETATGKRPSLTTVRASISAVSKLHYVSVDSEGRLQWNQPS